MRPPLSTATPMRAAAGSAASVTTVRAWAAATSRARRVGVVAAAAGEGGGGESCPPPPPAATTTATTTRPPSPPSGASSLNAAAASALWPGLGTSLPDLYNSVGERTRVRQHVNPLKKELQVPTSAPPDWADWFDSPAAPLALDAGCGSGRFGLALAASARPDHNVLGLEIRGPLVARANAWARAAVPALDRRARFVLGNATVSLPAGLLDSYPGPLTLACFQFPDPHFKARHHKRRIVQPATAAAVAAALAPGGVVFLQSDVLEAAVAMRDAFEAGAGDLLQPSPAHHTADVRAAAAAAWEEEAAAGNPADPPPPLVGWAVAGWVPANPLGVPTEREVHTLAQGKPVYRCVLVKKE
jgi:tRNA (guanine-N7-)-methyltransferase